MSSVSIEVALNAPVMIHTALAWIMASFQTLVMLYLAFSSIVTRKTYQLFVIIVIINI